MAQGPAPSIVWFRDDLRLRDHAGAECRRQGRSPLICVFVLDEESAGFRPHGGASRWWLAQSLRALDADLRQLGQRLVLRRGKAADVIPALAAQTSADKVYWNRRYDRAGIAADDAVIAALKSRGVSGGTFPGNLLVEPGRSRTRMAARCACSRRSGSACCRSASRVRRCRRRNPCLPRPMASPPTGWTTGISSRRSPTGPAACAKAGRPAKVPRASGLPIFWTTSRAMPTPATGRTSLRPRASPRICASAKSVAVEIFHAARFAADKGRAVARHREIPERARLARILLSPASLFSRPREQRICNRASTPSPGAATRLP